MTQIIKNKLLKYLYCMKSFGFEYHKSFEIFKKKLNKLQLSNNINELKLSVKNCYLCDLCKSRKNVLFGTGSTNSKIMFICDEPTGTQDEVGNFYVGKSGLLLVNIIENVLKLKKEEVYLTHLVKCKSISGANLANFDSCNDYLLKQIEIIKPLLIVLFGENVYSYFTNNHDFHKNKGRFIKFNSVNLIATYSPKILLRNPSLKVDTFNDMLKIKKFVEEF